MNRPTALASLILLMCGMLARVAAQDTVAPASKVPAITPVITIDDSIINPVVSEYILDAIDEAERNQAPALVIELDTPGGLLSSTRVIVKKMMNAQVPIIVYVSPSGARAGSAGVFITLASHVAAMAPSTNIGAAHPVEFGENPKKEKESLREWIELLRKEKGKGEKETKKGLPKTRPEEETVSKDPMTAKIMNDTVAWVSGIAKNRGRNVDWAVRAVTESISSGEEEAKRLGVVDVIAKDLGDLFTQIEGKKVHLSPDREVTLHLDSHSVERRKMTFRQRILNVLINPNIAYILMVLGFYGLLFEITHPGVWLPGVAGLICLILAFYAFHTLPTNYAGLALILLAIGLFVAETQVVSYGLLGLTGAISMVLGSLFLIDSTASFMQISLKLIIPVVGSTALIFFFLVNLALKSQRQKGISGVEALVGLRAQVSVPLPDGKVKIEGEIWDATSDQPVAKGENVQVVSVEGMRLRVKKV